MGFTETITLFPFISFNSPYIPLLLSFLSPSFVSPISPPFLKVGNYFPLIIFFSPLRRRKSHFPSPLGGEGAGAMKKEHRIALRSSRRDR